MRKTKQTFHLDTGLLEIECGSCGHEQEVEGIEYGGYNPFSQTEEETYFVYGSAADYCNDCDSSFGRGDDVERIKVG